MMILSSTSGVTTSSIISAARLLETNINETNHQRESSPTSGVIIPEEKRVTDRVKVFEAAANNNEQSMHLKNKQQKMVIKRKYHQSGSSSNDNKQNGKREPHNFSIINDQHLKVLMVNQLSDSKIIINNNNSSKN